MHAGIARQIQALSEAVQPENNARSASGDGIVVLLQQPAFRLFALNQQQRQIGGGQAQGNLLHLFARTEQYQRANWFAIANQARQPFGNFRSVCGAVFWAGRHGRQIKLALCGEIERALQGQRAGFRQPVQPRLAQQQVEIAQTLQGGGSEHHARRPPPKAVSKLLRTADGAGVELPIGFVVGHAAADPFGQRLFLFVLACGGHQLPQIGHFFAAPHKQAEIGSGTVDLHAVLVFVAPCGGKGIAQAV